MGLGRVAGAIWRGLGKGVEAQRAGNSIGRLGQAASKSDVLENASARFSNALLSPEGVANLGGTAIGIAYGQNPLEAIASNVIGNRVSAKVGRHAASQGWGQPKTALATMGADVGSTLAFGYGVGKLGEFLNPAPPTATEMDSDDRMLRAQAYSQAYTPVQGSSRQMTELVRTAGAYNTPASADSLAASIRPYSDPRVAGMVQSEIPPLDAATADKLRKRAIENAQSNQFLAGQLSGYMEGM